MPGHVHRVLGLADGEHQACREAAHGIGRIWVASYESELLWRWASAS